MFLVNMNKVTPPILNGIRFLLGKDINQLKEYIAKSNLLESVDSIYNSRIQYLDSKKDSLSTDFYHLCKEYLKAEKQYTLVYSRGFLKEEELKNNIMNDAISFVNKPSSENLLCFSRFETLLRILTREITQLKNKQQTPDIQSAYNLIKSNYKGTVKDYSMLHLVLENLDEENIVKQFYADCNTEEYKEYVRRKIDIKTEIEENKNCFMDHSRKLHSLTELLEQYKGKYVYVDVWASWCGPCRQLFPLSHRLQKIYQKDVVFVYLNTDDSYDKGFNVSDGENLNPDHSYWIKRDSPFLKEVLKIKGLPHYALFDREGKMMENDFIRPDDKEFESKMNELIK